MKANPREIQEILKTLADVPRRLTKASANADKSRLRLKPEPSAWSAVDVLAHLRACADVWGDSIEDMLAEDEPKIPYRHPRQWVKRTDYPQLDFASSLRAYIRQRKSLLKILNSLAFEQWERGAQIQGRRHTVFTQARRMALHEVEHCGQVERLCKT